MSRIILAGVVAALIVAGLTTMGQAAPSFDWNAAYQAAKPGDTIQVPAGSYGDVTLSTRTQPSGAVCRWGSDWQDGTSTPQDLTGCIHFVPVAGATVAIDNMNIQGPLVYLDGFHLTQAAGKGDLVVRAANGACPTPNPISDIVIRNTTAVGFLTRGQQQTYFVGDTFDHLSQGTGDFSNTVGFCPSPVPYQVGHFAIVSSTIENVLWTTAGQHIECIHWWSADHVTINRTQFLNCAQLDISMQGDSDLIRYVLIENNVFDGTCSHQSYASTGGCNGSNGGHALAISRYAGFPSSDHFTVRFNSMPVDDYISGGPPATGTWADFSEYGNVIGAYPNASYHCQGQISGGVQMDNNVFQNEPAGFPGCGPNSTIVAGATSVYANPAAFDYTELTTSPSVHVVPSGAPRPSLDLTGTARGTAATDAGAYISGSPPTQPPPPIPSVTVTACTGPSYTLTWTAVPGASGYNLYRDGTKVSSAGAAATSAKFLSLCGTKSLGVSVKTSAGESTVTTRQVP